MLLVISLLVIIVLWKPAVAAGPDHFVLRNLRLAPERVAPGQEIRILVDVHNASEYPGSKEIFLLINGKVVEKTTISIPPEEFRPVIFAVKQDRVGSYVVQVEELTTTFSVYNPAALLIVIPLILLFTAAVIGASVYLYYEAKRQIRLMNQGRV